MNSRKTVFYWFISYFSPWYIDNTIFCLFSSKCSGITSGSVLNGKLYAHRFQRKIHLHLFIYRTVSWRSLLNRYKKNKKKDVFLLTIEERSSWKSSVNTDKLQKQGGFLENSCDDGEYGAVRLLLRFLQDNNIVNKIMIVTLWYGGKHMGQRRYECIMKVAKEILHKDRWTMKSLMLIMPHITDCDILRVLWVIPWECREQLKSKTEKTTENNLSGRSKKIYQTFKCLHVKQPSCIQAWNRQYNIRFDGNEWKKLFVLPWKLTEDHILIEFQYKILHKIFGSQSYVSRFDRNVPELCIKGRVRANTIHMFFKCDDVKRFRNDFVPFFRDFLPSQMLELENVLLGLLESDCEIINLCVLHAKWFMYIQYMSDSSNFSGVCKVRNYCEKYS